MTRGRQRRWTEEQVKSLLGDSVVERLLAAESRQRSVATIKVSDADLRDAMSHIEYLTEGGNPGTSKANLWRSAFSRVLSKMVVDSAGLRGSVVGYITRLQGDVTALTNRVSTGEFVCDECGREAVSASGLGIHLSRVHKRRGPNYERNRMRHEQEQQQKKNGGDATTKESSNAA